MYFSSERTACPIYYDVIPNVTACDTVFLHGNLASSEWWRPVIDTLKASPQGSGDAYLIDWRGCGLSNKLQPSDRWNAKEAANDCIDLIKELDLKQTLIVGHSTGGLLAQYCLQALPDTLKSAVLLDPVTPFGMEFDPELLNTFELMKNDRGVCRDVLATTILGVDPEDDFFQLLVDQAMNISSCIWKDVPSAVAHIEDPPNHREIVSPVLVLHGEYDEVLESQESQRLAAELPQGTFEAIPNAGHSYNVENPTKFCDYLRQFSVN